MFREASMIVNRGSHQSLRNICGVTLLEIMLVLSIAALLIIMSVNMTKYWLYQNNVQLLKVTVDQLFDAAASYYKANCGITNIVVGPASNGPLVGTSSPYAISPAALVTAGYLKSNWNQPVNSLVNTTDPSGGYLVQYNLVSNSAINASCTAPNCIPSNTTFPSGGASTGTYKAAINNNMSALVWIIQISVLMANTSTSSMIRIGNYLGYSCMTAEVGTTQTTPCPAIGATPAWLAWMRLPAFASPGSSTPLYLAMPMVKELNLQYTHDQMYELSAQTYNGTSSSSAYYTCGE
jgi:hypothetical protein